MKADDELCFCFHVTWRKVINYIRRHDLKHASQVAECYGAGTGCGWCRRQIIRLMDEVKSRPPENTDLDDWLANRTPTSQSHAEGRAKYWKRKKPNLLPPGLATRTQHRLPPIRRTHRRYEFERANPSDANCPDSSHNLRESGDNRKRLLCCSSTMDSGGSERQTWNLLRGINRQKFDPRLYLLYQQGPLLEQLPNDVAIEAYWSRHQPLKMNWPGRVHRLQIGDLVNILRRDRIDVVYERLFHMAMIAGPACRRTGVKHVANIVSPPRSDVPRSEIKFAWMKRLVLSRAYREADRLLAVSQGAADDAAAYYGIPRGKFEVVWNPVDIERLDRLKNEAWTGKRLTTGP